MRIAVNYFGAHHDTLLRYAQELGIRYAVCTVPAESACPTDPKPWHLGPLQAQQQRMSGCGMELEVLEGIKFIDSAKLGRPDRDDCIREFCLLLENAAALGIKTVCYNWMPVWGWFRSRYDIPARGGAMATGFSAADVADKAWSAAGRVTADELWTNLEYFMKKVVPVAEKCRVQLALHPDDPPVDSIAGIDRILTSADAMMQAIDLAPSEFNGITMCQGTFATMGEDVPAQIRRFGSRIFFAHLRDVKGVPTDFAETFPDDGITNVPDIMQAYYDIGFGGVIRPDHTPTLFGESNANPGYAVLGNLFSIGYLRGLMESIEHERSKE